MTATSRWPAVVTGIVAALRALPGYRAPGQNTDGVTVYDGPEVGLHDVARETFIVIGHSTGLDDIGGGGSGAQRTAVLGTTRRRDETGVVDVLIVAQDGGGDVPGLRTTAYAVLADLEQLLLGVGVDAGSTDPGRTWRAVLTATAPDQRQTEDGGICAITASFTYEARL